MPPVRAHGRRDTHGGRMNTDEVILLALSFTLGAIVGAVLVEILMAPRINRDQRTIAALRATLGLKRP